MRAAELNLQCVKTQAAEKYLKLDIPRLLRNFCEWQQEVVEKPLGRAVCRLHLQ